jgi:hypothetical protein
MSSAWSAGDSAQPLTGRSWCRAAPTSWIYLPLSEKPSLTSMWKVRRPSGWTTLSTTAAPSRNSTATVYMYGSARPFHRCGFSTASATRASPVAASVTGAVVVATVAPAASAIVATTVSVRGGPALRRRVTTSTSARSGVTDVALA